MHGVSLGAVSLGAILAFLLIFLVARRVNIDEAAERAKEKSGLTGFTNEAIIDTIDNDDAASLRSYNTKF